MKRRFQSQQYWGKSELRWSQVCCFWSPSDSFLNFLKKNDSTYGHNLWSSPEKDLPWKTIPAPGIHPANIPRTWLLRLSINPEYADKEFGVSNEHFWNTYILWNRCNRWKYANRKETPFQYFKFECVKTFRRHSSFVFLRPLHRRDQCWPHRCRRGWRSERKQRFSLPTHIWLNFLKSIWILTSWVSRVQIFTLWRDVPRKSITICRFHP